MMDDAPLEWRRGEYLVSTSRGRLDTLVVLALLQTTHRGGMLTQPRLEQAIANSVCFGMYHGAALAGFGRVITADGSRHD